MIQDWGTAIFNSLANAVNLILTFIPRLIGFLVILIVGLIVAALVAKAVTFLLRKAGFDRLSNRIGLTRLEQRMNVKLDPAAMLGRIVYWFILLIFLIPAADALGLPTVSNILNTLVAYIPNVFVAILVLFLGTLAATFVADIVQGVTASTSIGSPRVFSAIARWSIISFAALIALEQLQIAPALIAELFGAAVLSVALALGLSFGLGGQDAARRWLARGEGTMTVATAQLSAQQKREQALAAQRQVERESLNRENAVAYQNQANVPQNQTGYVPNQEGYAPNQSGYVPNQGGYAPNQDVPREGNTPNP